MKLPITRISNPPAYHFWVVNFVFSTPSVKSVNAVSRIAIRKRVKTLRVLVWLCNTEHRLGVFLGHS